MSDMKGYVLTTKCNDGPNARVEDLNSLVGSRICHDLISPLGAISNGVELLGLSGFSAAPEMTLIAESIKNATARIRFFRVSFGAANNTAMFSGTEADAIVNDVFKGSRLNVAWHVAEDTLRCEVKLAFLLLQCIESALPRGGEVEVSRSNGLWCLFARGEKVRIELTLWDFLDRPALDGSVAASNVHFALVSQAVHTLGRRVTCDFTERTVSLSF